MSITCTRSSRPQFSWLGRRAGVPVVASVHNQHLTCPRSDHLYHGELCDRCVGGGEINCVLRNCRDNIFESVAYAARSAFARRSRLFHDNVTLFIALSQFAKERLITAGFDGDRIVVLPNMVNDAAVRPIRDRASTPRSRPHERGEGCADPPRCGCWTSDEQVRLAGSGPLLDELSQSAPANVKLLGRLDSEQMQGFYRRARFVVVPSITYEMCPLVILEAMSHGIPVIASALGAQRELVDDGVDGLLFDPGDAEDLRRAMRRLWDNPELCHELGQAGYRRVREQHSRESYYRRLSEIYDRAIAMTQGPDETTNPASFPDELQEPAALEARS